MGAPKLIAVALISGGVLGLDYGGFSYPNETHTADIGALHFPVAENQRDNVAIWVGIGGIWVGIGGILGGVLLATSSKT